MNCPICDNKLTLRWTDTHGTAACSHCCSPFQLYKYEGEPRKRIVLDPPKHLLLPEWIPTMRRYWEETHARAPHGFDMPGSGYSGFNNDDIKTWNAWCEKNKASFPPKRTE